MTAMAEAFSVAGYLTPDERLIAIGVTAWAKFPQNDAGHARRAYVAAELTGSLAWALWQQWDQRQIVMAIGRLLNDTRQAIEAERPGAKPDGGGGQGVGDTQSANAPAVTQDAGASRRSTEAAASATPSQPSPSAPTIRPGTVDAKVRVAARLSALDTVIINALPLRRVRVGEARDWADVHHKRARFVYLVTANMPDHWIVGDHMPDDLADELFRRAEHE